MKIPAIVIDIRLGARAYEGPPFITKFDQTKLPNEKMKGPVSRARYMALLIKSFPGDGLLLLVKSIYLLVIYIKIRPPIPNTHISGCKET
jgi:hypothetical protein